MAVVGKGNTVVLTEKSDDMRPAIQLYTLRNVGDSLRDRLERVSETRYEGVQFAGLDGASPERVAATLAETGLDAADAHISVSDLEDEYDRTIETHRALGCDRLVVAAYEREAFESRAGARAAGEHLAELAARVAEDGFSLHYHNHAFEFGRLDGDETAFEVFAEAAEGVGFEIDTGLANYAGVAPVRLLERYGDRVDLVHLTDSRPDAWENRHCDLGTGTVDIEACVATADEIDAEWLVFEHGTTDEPVASMTNAANTLVSLLD